VDRTITPRIELIPIEDIDISPANVRKHNTEERVPELMHSIAELGLRQPIHICDNEVYEGQRRYRAFKLAQQEGCPGKFKAYVFDDKLCIPCIVDNKATELQQMLRSLAEGATQEPFAHESIRDAILKLKDTTWEELGDRKMTIDEMVKAVGLSKPSINSIISFHEREDIPKKTKERFKEASAKKVRTLNRMLGCKYIKKHPEKRDMLEDACEALSQDVLDQYARELNGGIPVVEEMVVVADSPKNYYTLTTRIPQDLATRIWNLRMKTGFPLMLFWAEAGEAKYKQEMAKLKKT